MKKPINDLGEEHGGITLMLEVMGKMAQRLAKGENVSKDHLKKVVDFLKNFADKCHHGKEEDILFPEIAKNKGSIILVNELLGEHKTGRDYIRGIVESLDTYQPGNPDAFHIAANMKGYISLLSEHIRKENALLFPIADKQLSENLQAKIEKKFETLEHDVIGAGKHEEYHGWLEELKEAYAL